MAVKSFLLLTVALTLSVSQVFSQRLIRPEGLPPTEPIATWVIGSSGDSVTVCFGYSVPYARIIFTKSGESRQEFSAVLSFSVDAADSASGINYHRFHKKELKVDDFAATRSRTSHCSDFVSATLPMSDYKVTAELRDDNQQIRYLNYTGSENFNITDDGGIFSILFVDSISNNHFYPEIRKDIAPFPGEITAVILADAANGKPLGVTLRTIEGQNVLISDSLVPLKVKLVPGRSGNDLFFEGIPDTASSIYIARFRNDSLPEGKYELEFTTSEKKKTHVFSYSWLDKPFSLRDIRTALPLLEYIAPDSIYSLINSGNEQEKREKFEAYWKSHDPTPNTAYNELEAEFYNRADYAAEHFRTLASGDGAATDRGKAYILYGPPARVKREFLTGGTYEFWYYPNLKSVLVFKEERFGEFKLYRTEKS